MTEAELLARIGELARSRGLLWVHVTAPYMGRSEHRGDYGFPDLVIAGPGGQIFAELKAGGRLDPEQARWRDVLQAAGASWRLWRPADLLTGEVAAELDALSAPER